MKISIIGGGGTRVPVLVQKLLDLREQLDLTEISLVDADADRMSAIGRVLDAIIRQHGAPVTITRADDFRSCVTGASFVVAAVRVGGDHLRVLDERIPLSMGVLGQETVGAGGFAMAVRTVPVVLDMMRDLHDIAPDAWFINLTNPSGLVTQAILSHGGSRNAVGICDAPASMAMLAAHVLQADPADVVLDYYGLNHCAFVKSVRVLGADVLPHVLATLCSLPELESMTHFTPSYLRRLGKLPNPYIWYYAFKRESLSEALAAGETRGEVIERQNGILMSQLATTDDPIAVYNSYLEEREDGHAAREVRHLMNVKDGEGYGAIAAEVLLGLSGRRQSAVAVNVLNQGALPFLAPDDVVEVPALISERLIRPFAVGPVDTESQLLIQHVKAYERSLVDAIVYRDTEELIRSLALNPLVPSPEVARELVRAFREQEAPYFDMFR